jgi:hypothetical protein
MTWTTPPTRANGDVITATIWNQDVGSNPKALADFVPASGGYVTRSGTNLLFSPDVSNACKVYESAQWTPKIIPDAGITVAATGLTADTDYYLYVYDSAGTLTLDLVTTVPVTQNGINVKTGATSRTLIARCRANASGAITTYIEDASTQLINNTYNKRPIGLKALEATDQWTYATNAYRSANASTANRVQMVCDGRTAVCVRVGCLTNQNQFSYLGIGLDSVTVSSHTLASLNDATNGNLWGHAYYTGVPASGFHFFQWLEHAALGTATFWGDNGGTLMQSGIIAEGWF